MQIQTILGIVGFAIAMIATPVFLLFLIRGVRSMNDIRNLFRRPPYDYGQRSTKGE